MRSGPSRLLPRDFVELPQRSHIRFHLLSSAGGLFEGQRNVGSVSVPRPFAPMAKPSSSRRRSCQSLRETQSNMSIARARFMAATVAVGARA